MSHGHSIYCVKTYLLCTADPFQKFHCIIKTPQMNFSFLRPIGWSCTQFSHSFLAMPLVCLMDEVSVFAPSTWVMWWESCDSPSFCWVFLQSFSCFFFHARQPITLAFWFLLFFSATETTLCYPNMDHDIYSQLNVYHLLQNLLSKIINVFLNVVTILGLLDLFLPCNRNFVFCPTSTKPWFSPLVITFLSIVSMRSTVLDSTFQLNMKHLSLYVPELANLIKISSSFFLIFKVAESHFINLPVFLPRPSSPRRPPDSVLVLPHWRKQKQPGHSACSFPVFYNHPLSLTLCPHINRDCFCVFWPTRPK